MWHHCGDLTAISGSMTLELEFGTFTDLFWRYPALQALGHEHALMFVSMLNAIAACCNDLFDSNSCIDAYCKFGNCETNTSGTFMISTGSNVSARSSACSVLEFS